MLRIEGLSKAFGNANVLKNVSFSMKDGRITAFLGPNGAGKTTTIRALLGIIRPDTGKFYMDTTPYIPEQVNMRKNISFVLENASLYERLNGYENMYFVAQIWQLEKSMAEERIKKLFNELEIDYGKKPVKLYSKGMKQKLILARALLPSCRYLILDEPLSGIDIPTKHIIREVLKKEKNNGKAIMYSTHILEEVEELAQEVIVIAHGEIRFKGSINEFRSIDNDIETAFMRLVI